jgi:hypothetical protein
VIVIKLKYQEFTMTVIRRDLFMTRRASKNRVGSTANRIELPEYTDWGGKLLD